MSDAVTLSGLTAWVRAFAALIEASKNELTQLDSAIGDADHGTNMDRGMTAVLAALVVLTAAAIVPGFVRGAGMYDRMERGTGARAPRLVGVTTPEAVGRAVVYALERDPCEVIVNAVPVRALCGLAEVFPDLGGRIGRWFGSDAVLQGWARFNDRSVEGVK
jgi:hypothetical protein